VNDQYLSTLQNSDIQKPNTQKLDSEKANFHKLRKSEVSHSPSEDEKDDFVGPKFFRPSKATNLDHPSEKNIMLNPILGTLDDVDKLNENSKKIKKKKKKDKSEKKAKKEKKNKKDKKDKKKEK